MDRILLPTDFSPHAAAALSHAALFARSFDAELHVLNVQVPYGPTSPLLDQYPGEEDARATLDALEIATPNVVREMRRGIAVAPTVLEYADDELASRLRFHGVPVSGLQFLEFTSNSIIRREA